MCLCGIMPTNKGRMVRNPHMNANDQKNIKKCKQRFLPSRGRSINVPVWHYAHQYFQNGTKPAHKRKRQTNKRQYKQRTAVSPLALSSFDTTPSHRTMRSASAKLPALEAPASRTAVQLKRVTAEQRVVRRKHTRRRLELFDATCSRRPREPNRRNCL